MTGISINTNVLSLSMQNSLSKTTQALASSMEKLATGQKLNRAADGAAQLNLSTKLGAQISGMTVAQDNVQQGSLMLDQADSGLQAINENLSKIRDLAVQASSGTYSQEQRNAMAIEAKGYAEQINNISRSTSFNGLSLLDGSLTEMKLQVGANSGDRMDIAGAFLNASASALGVSASAIDTAFASADAANLFIATTDNAISQTSGHLATVGSFANSLSSVLDNLKVKTTNMESSRSQIMDVDYASETSKYLQLQIRQEANISLLSQANMLGTTALSLL